MMRIPFKALLLSTLVLAGCGAVRDSRLNPVNWFGGSRTEALPAGEANALIPQRSTLKRRAKTYQGQPVDTITDLTIERAAGGAIVRVTGQALAQGSYEVYLIPENREEPENATLTYTLMAIPAAGPQRQGTAPSREIVVARFVSDKKLEGVRTIRVIGVSNARSSRR